MGNEMQVRVLPNKGKKFGKDKYFGGGYAYTYAFVYTPKDSILLKGFLPEIEECIKNDYPTCIAKITMYKGGTHRGYWNFYVNGSTEDIMIEEPERAVERRHFRIQVKDKENKYQCWFAYRRLPKRWIEDYNNIVDWIIEYRRMHKVKKNRYC